MKIIDKRLRETSNLINKHFDLIQNYNRAEESTEILSRIRDYCELVLYKIYDEENKQDLYQTYENLKIVKKFIKTFNNDFYTIHQLLNCSGHIMFGIEQSEALMIKYIPMLISMKTFIHNNYNFITLESIDKYPLSIDDSLLKFYRKILNIIMLPSISLSSKNKTLYYINKKAIKYIDGEIFYEYVLDVSDDKPNRFNTIIAYSKLNINLKYDMNFTMFIRKVNFLDSEIPINIITDYDIFIRPCSFRKILNLINVNLAITSRNATYLDLMSAIKKLNCSLLDIIEYDIHFTDRKDLYVNFCSEIKKFISYENSGVNLIKFLLLNMRYSVIKGQLNMHLYNNKTTTLNPFFNGLKISSGSLGFEHNPIAFSPLVLSPTIEELSRLFDLNEYKHEFLYKKIEKYINQNNVLFVDCEAIGLDRENIEKLVKVFNQKLYSYYYSDYKIIKVYDKYTINSYYKKTIEVLQMINELSQKSNSPINTKFIDDCFLSNDKKFILSHAFNNSSICIVSGAAGTGKTSLIREFLKLNTDKNILCITTTNTAKNNLKGDYGTNVIYKNTSEYISHFREYDFIIIDEASFISTESIFKILENNPNSNYLIVGDSYQIESILFGNWFKLCLTLFKDTGTGVLFNLDTSHRAKTSELQKIWDTVRNVEGTKENKILELLSTFEFAKTISKEAITFNDNQIVLCLSYEGLYGINNLNRYLQCSNKNDGVVYQQNIYKINDPVIFVINEYERFGLYNNIKGKIINIRKCDRKYIFYIELENNLNVNITLSEEIKLDSTKEKTIVIIIKEDLSFDDYDNELLSRSKLPFQLAYAMSIHKAQGLEFDNVKIIITADSENYISKNIFYTAITRARKKLEIFWDPEVPNTLFKNIIEESKASFEDVEILKKLIYENKIKI